MRLSGSPAARASCCCRLQNDLCLSSRGQAVGGLRRAEISGAPFSLRACVGLHSTHRRTTGCTLCTVALPRHPRSFDSSCQPSEDCRTLKSVPGAAQCRFYTCTGIKSPDTSTTERGRAVFLFRLRLAPSVLCVTVGPQVRALP
eukprot:m.411141 g.411141  ORF g.411141 m.411141 type:complete len:144 (-) comp56550_c0_seq6:137-568(-)